MKGQFSPETYFKIANLHVNDYIRHNNTYMVWEPDIRAGNSGQCYRVTAIHFPNIYVYKCGSRRDELIYVRKSTRPKPTHVIHLSHTSYYIVPMSDEDRLFLSFHE